MNSIRQTSPNQADSGGYGPMGTPDAGRAERIARYDRDDALRYRAAAERLGRGGADDAEVHRLRDRLGDVRREMARLRAELPALVDAEVRRILADDLPEAIEYLVGRREVPRNGTAAQASHR